MADDGAAISDGLYMTVEQYLALDEATDAKYEYFDLAANIRRLKFTGAMVTSGGSITIEKAISWSLPASV